MKRAIFFLILYCNIGFAWAQTRYAFVNLDYILVNIPDYTKAQLELDEYSKKLQVEIDAVYRDIDEMRSKYQTDKVFLTASMQEQREKAIAEKENKARILQQEYFGPRGELFIKREELVKPIQDEILEAIKDLAKEGNYGVILDVSADHSVLFYDPKLDKSKTILRKLGYSTTKSEE
ncbi:OmpH family outer membrane protein [Odoribacter lunatus]|uniref:OmpH family outer membrane protein n=1 Tax=Odoribacter lunatus TaxID=2941335 RepID=UPI00203EB9C9|nr:OmpH family outer membrane protein [Odoribacter lunatus]